MNIQPEIKDMEIIKLKAMLLIQNEGRLLVWKGFDEIKKQWFYRLLGGHVEFHETAEAAVRREIMEEIGSEIESLELIAIIENIFIYQGNRGHEIDYLFAGNLQRTELFDQDQVSLHEDHEVLVANWVNATEVTNGQIPLYPPHDYASFLAKTKK